MFAEFYLKIEKINGELIITRFNRLLDIIFVGQNFNIPKHEINL